jgi:hypothetical protein
MGIGIVHSHKVNRRQEHSACSIAFTFSSERDERIKIILLNNNKTTNVGSSVS